MNDIGRPEHTEEQYQEWLVEMEPYLKVGYSLYSAMDKASLLRHKDTMYRKYRLNDWFCEKIEVYRRYPSEVVNSIFTRLILSVDEKIDKGQYISAEEWRNVRFFAEKHRSCQSDFMYKAEVVKIEPDRINRMLDGLETDYNELGQKAQAMLEATSGTG